ncbi:hypothetical protein Ndes2526B_g00517 [Nannochloris sp. 'desiccata']
MSADSTRDRRGPLFGAPAPQNHGKVDPESLERENDQNIAALGERVGFLRNITSGIHGETESHHAVLDRMAMGMGSVGLGLGGAVGKFNKVMDDPQGRRTVYIAIGITAALFLLYIWWR